MPGFRHEAVFYTRDDEYLAGTLPALRSALEDDGAAMVAVGDDKWRLLHAALGGAATRVQFVDMERLVNPACIIPAWREFLRTAGDGPIVGVGEPAWPGRGADELVECSRHEALLNLASTAAARGGCCARTTRPPSPPTRSRPRRRRRSSSRSARTTSRRRASS